MTVADRQGRTPRQTPPKLALGEARPPGRAPTGGELPQINGNYGSQKVLTKGGHTPAMLHLLRTILFSVRVPVLSQNM